MKRSAARTRVRALVNEPTARARFFQDSAINTWIDEGIKDICVKTFCLQKLCSAMSTSPDTTAYAYPTVCNTTSIVTIGIKTILNSSNESMNYVPLDLMGRVAYDTVMTTWSVWDDKIILNPVLTAAGNMTPLVWVMEGCTVDNTEFPIPAEYHNAVPLYAAYKAYQKRKIFEASKNIRVEYVNELNRLSSTLALRSQMTSSKTTIADQVPMFTGLEEGEAGLMDIVVAGYSIYHSAALAVQVSRNNTATGSAPELLASMSTSETAQVPSTATVSGQPYFFSYWTDNTALSTSRTFPNGGTYTAYFDIFTINNIEMSMNTATFTVAQTISTVDMGRTMILASHVSQNVAGGTGWHHMSQCRVWLKDANTVAAQREDWAYDPGFNTNTVTLKINVQVVEFPQWYLNSVQRGYLTLTGTKQCAIETVNTYNTATTVLIYNGKSYQTTGPQQVDHHNQSSGMSVQLWRDTPTTIKCQRSRSLTSTTVSARVGWQLIEFNDTVVKSIQCFDIVVSAESVLQTQTISAVNTAATIIIPTGANGQYDQLDNGRYAYWLCSSTTMGYYCNDVGGGLMTEKVQVVEFYTSCISSHEQKKWDDCLMPTGQSAIEVALNQVVGGTRAVVFQQGFNPTGDTFGNYFQRIWVDTAGTSVHVEQGKSETYGGTARATSPFSVVQFM